MKAEGEEPSQHMAGSNNADQTAPYSHMTTENTVLRSTADHQQEGIVEEKGLIQKDAMGMNIIENEQQRESQDHETTNVFGTQDISKD